MTTTQTIKNPYTFNKDAWHCKLFKWCYDVNPPDVFKTMCPYFWSFVGTLLIIPFIVLAKTLRIPSKSIGEFVSNRIKDCETYKQKRKTEKYAKIEAKNLANLNEYYLIIKSIMDNPEPNEDELVAAYKFLDSKKISTLSIVYYIRFNLNIMDYCEANKYIQNFNTKISCVKKKVQKESYDAAMNKKKLKNNTDINLKKMIDNKIFKWILIIIVCAIITYIVGSLFYSIYILFVKIIIPNIKIIMTALSKLFIILFLSLMFVFSIYQFFKCWGETITDSLDWFFKILWQKLCWLGKRFVYLLGYCKPLLKIFLIFEYTALGFILIGRTIHAIYKQYCPIITWVDK